MTADLATPNTAPTTPPTPTLSVGTAGALTYTYALVDYTVGSADSVQGGTVTTALAASGSINTLTFTAVPALTFRKVIRTAAPAGITTGYIGTALAGATTFVDSNLGGTAYVANTTGTTYSAASVSLPGTKAIKVSGTVTTTDLRGDNTLLDSDTMLSGVAVELDHAKLSLDVLNIMLGGAVTDTGSTPNQQSSWALLNPPVFNYFRVEGRSVTADPVLGDVHYIWPKVKLADFPQLGLAEENYQLFNLKCKALPPIGGGSWMQVLLNETAQLIAA